MDLRSYNVTDYRYYAIMSIKLLGQFHTLQKLTYNMILGRKWLAYPGLQLNVWNRRLVWPETMPPTPSFVKEISITMENLVRPRVNTVHQADVERRDRAFEKDVQLDPQRIRILRRPQVTNAMPPVTEVQEVSREPVKLPTRNRAT